MNYSELREWELINRPRTGMEVIGPEIRTNLTVVPLSRLQEVEKDYQLVLGKRRDAEEDRDRAIRRIAAAERRAIEAERACKRSDDQAWRYWGERNEAREALAAIRRAVEVIEDWGADNGEKSEEEGDVPDERYKAFALAASFLRSKLPLATAPVEGEAQEQVPEAVKREQAVDQLLEIAKLAHDDVMRGELEGLASRLSYPPPLPHSTTKDPEEGDHA